MRLHVCAHAGIFLCNYNPQGVWNLLENFKQIQLLVQVLKPASDCKLCKNRPSVRGKQLNQLVTLQA